MKFLGSMLALVACLLLAGDVSAFGYGRRAAPKQVVQKQVIVKETKVVQQVVPVAVPVAAVQYVTPAVALQAVPVAYAAPVALQAVPTCGYSMSAGFATFPSTSFQTTSFRTQTTFADVGVGGGGFGGGVGVFGGLRQAAAQGAQTGGLAGALERLTGLGDGSGQVATGAALGILASRANLFGLGRKR